MKNIYVLVSILAFSCFLPKTGLQSQGIPTESRIYKNTAQECTFFLKKIQEILETKIKAYEAIATEDTNDDVINEWAHHFSHIAGYCLAILIFSQFFKTPQDILSFFNEILKATICIGIGGPLISYLVIESIISNLANLLSNITYEQTKKPNFVYRETLLEFIRHWQEFKLFTPLSLHNQIDDLYQQYLKHHAQLTINEDEALCIVENLIEEGLAYEKNEKNTGTSQH